MEPQALANLDSGQRTAAQLIEEMKLGRDEKNLRAHEAPAELDDLGG